MRNRTTRRIYPALPDEDMTIVRWLIREGFEHSYNRDSLQVLHYDEQQVPWQDGVAAAVEDGADATAIAANAGRPLQDFTWWIFTCRGETDEHLMDYLTAESAWHRDQYAAWLEAETAAQRAP
ncbi:MAG: hypothetical protein E6R06_10800 [Mycobacterium sp.]|jgi:hypothetical protein|nr:MAG: hypothetical protein E6R06_10800 [Mycobacterium sp.]